MSTARQYIPHYTAADYQQWKGAWELWNGVAVAMGPSPFGRHAQILAHLAMVLGNAIDTADCAATILAEIDWIVSGDTILRPDLTIVCGGAPQRHVEQTPALVVEILSESTRERDLTYKKNLYQQEAVRWYLIVDPEGDDFQALKLDASGTYQTVPYSEILCVDICDKCSLSVCVDRLFGSR